MHYDPHQVYQEARDIVRYYFDLQLTPIEAVKLRYYVRDALDPTLLLDLDSLMRWRCSWDGYVPAVEAVSRFFSREYGILPHTDMDNMLHGIVNKDFNAYLKIKQEKSHFP